MPDLFPELDPAGSNDSPSPNGWLNRTICCSAAMLMLLNAVTLRDWAADLPPGRASNLAQAIGNGWFDLTDALGLNQPRLILRQAWLQVSTGKAQRPLQARRARRG